MLFTVTSIGAMDDGYPRPSAPCGAAVSFASDGISRPPAYSGPVDPGWPAHSIESLKECEKGSTYVTVGCCNNCYCSDYCCGCSVPNFCANVGNLWTETTNGLWGAISYLLATKKGDEASPENAEKSK